MDDKEQVQRKVEALPFWYHRIELPHGIVTPGWAPIDPSAYKIPENLDEKRVLDDRYIFRKTFIRHKLLS